MENTTQTTKNCLTCKKDVPLTDYHNAKLGKLGKTAHCKVCTASNYLNKRVLKDMQPIVDANLKRIKAANTSMVFTGNLERNAGVTRFITLEKDLLKLHGKKLNFAGSKYQSTHTPMNVICKVHGEVFIEPANLLQGQGCFQCGRDKCGSDNSTGLTKTLAMATKKFEGKFDYSTVTEYKSQYDTMEFTCPLHGKQTMVFKDHLNNESGCVKCGNILSGIRKRGTTEDFIKQAIEIQGNKFDYSKVDYVTSNTKVEIYCKEHKGYFWQTPSGHLNGKGCRQCAKYGFRIEKPGRIYYLRVEMGGLTLYKIGITNRTVQERFRKNTQFITVLKERMFKNGKTAETIEGLIIKRYAAFKYIGPDILINGNTELFTIDILKLDKERQ